MDPPTTEIYSYCHTLSLHDALPISFSPAYAAYGAAGVPFWLLLAAVGRRTGDVRIRAAAVALVGAAVVAGFLLLFPECRSGPLGAIPLELREAWLSRVSEARGLVALAVKTPGHAVQLTLLPVIALFVCVTRIRRGADDAHLRSEEHTSELQSLMRISYAVFCLKKKRITQNNWTGARRIHTVALTTTPSE